MSPYIKIDTLLLSDLHLGSPIGKPNQVRKLLTTYAFKRLILLGDVFDYHADFHRLSKENHDLLELIHSYAHTHGREVIWIRGNHDHNKDGSVAKFIGAPILDEYAWHHAGKSYLAIHGDQYDAFIDNKSTFNAMAHVVFLQIQRMDRKGRHIVKLIDYANAKIRRLSSKIARGAIRTALERNANIVFCGHTHIAAQLVHNHGPRTVYYYNTGCWTHTPSTFVVVDEAGNVLVEKFK